jgi:hypothetical protein
MIAVFSRADFAEIAAGAPFGSCPGVAGTRPIFPMLQGLARAASTSLALSGPKSQSAVRESQSAVR